MRARSACASSSVISSSPFPPFAAPQTFQLPEMDRDSFTKTEYLARSQSRPGFGSPLLALTFFCNTFLVDVAMGGRVAEEVIYGKENVTSGAHSDLVAASDVANGMVKSMGFSDKVGLVAHGDESVYLSERKKDEIESEVRRSVTSHKSLLEAPRLTELSRCTWLTTLALYTSPV